MPGALPARLTALMVGRGTTVTRIHRSASIEPFFGPRPGDPPAHRFDDPLGEFRVCYLGEHASASFVETFLRNPPVRIVTRAELAKRTLSTFRLTREVRLVKLHGKGLAFHGCTADMTSSPPPYTESQEFSRTVWDHPDRPDGIQYRCRHDNALLAIALYDRAAAALEEIATEHLVADRPRLLDWRRRYGFEIG